MLIAFTGRMGSGKSTAAQLLVNTLGTDKAIILKFAEPLYQMQDVLYGMAGFPMPEKDRELLQFLGTDWARKKDPDVWCRLFRAKAQKLLDQGMIVICDDMRFDNEVNTIMGLGGAIVQMIGVQRGSHVINTGHASEHGINDLKPEYTISNLGSLYDLENNVRSVYNKLIGSSVTKDLL